MEILSKKTKKVTLNDLQNIEEFKNIPIEKADELLVTINNLANLIYSQSKSETELKIKYIQNLQAA